MNYCLCLKCGHEGPIEEFRVVADDGVDLTKMDLNEAIGQDLKFECPKCAGTEVNIHRFPVKKS